MQTQQQMRYAQSMPQQRQYAMHPQPPPPPQRQHVQYVQGQGPPVYQRMPVNPAPAVATAPAVTTVMGATATPKERITTVTRRKTRTNSDADEVLDAEELSIPTKVEGQLVANAVLAGSLLLSFRPDQSVSNPTEARILSLQLVALGCFLSAVSFHGMYLQRGGGHILRSWAWFAQLLSIAGVVLLVAAVALATRMQLGEEHERAWIASLTATIALVVIPIVCDIAFVFSKLAMNLLDSFDELFK